MTNKYLSFTLVCLLLLTANFSLVSAQTRTDRDSPKIAKIKDKLTKRETGEKKRVTIVKLDGAKLKGYVGQMSEDSFTLVEAKTNRNIAIDYKDVAKVNNRMTKGDKIALVIVGAAAATVAIIGISLYSIIANN